MSVFARVLLMLVASAAAAPCSLAEQAPAPNENRLLALMPELRKLPSPDWVKEGLRVNYYTAAATLPAERFYYYKDERGVLARGDEAGPAGGGIMQYTVIARSDTGVVGNLDLYMQDVGSGVVVPSYGGGVVDPAGAGACWANPAALAKGDRFQDNDLLVMKAPYPLGGKTYRSIRFRYVSARAVTDDVYDLDSGLWLFHGKVVLSADGRYTHLTQATFRSRRQVILPAANAAAPEFIQVKQIAFQGALTVMIPGSPTFPMPVSLSLQKTGGGARWAKYQLTRQSQGQMPSTLDLFCGAAQIPGEPWTSPALLRAVKPGQVLDRDPDVPYTLQAEGTQPGPTGEAVVITQAGNGFRRVYVYDLTTGRELMLTSQQQVGMGIQQTQLQMVR